jgi:hypothetical protein
MTEKEEQTPEDLGIKIGSEAEAFWTNAKEKILQETKKAKYEIEINNHVLKLCEQKIQEENKQKV